MAAAPTVLEVVVTREDVVASEGSFRRLFQGRSRRLTTTLNDLPVVGRRNLFKLLQVLCPLGWFLGLFLTGGRVATDAPFEDVWPWGLMTLGFGVLSVFTLFVGFDLAEELLLRVTDRLSAISARKTVARTLPITPFRVTYTIDGDEWRTDVDEPKISKRWKRGEATDVVSDGPVGLVYRSRNSQRFQAIVWITTPEVRAAFEGFVG